MTFADYAIAFNRQLANLSPPLAAGYRFMNPFQNGDALTISTQFYQKFYSDHRPRRLILGINPGRHGAGVTGVPFTDSKQLEKLALPTYHIRTHETSAVFIYRVIEAMGGAAQFYQCFYINSPLPLGLLYKNSHGRWVNANYYDNKTLQQQTRTLIDQSMAYYRTMPLNLETVYCLGMGKNYQFLQAWNQQHRYFQKIVALPHPRFVMQYRLKQSDIYLKQYMEALSQ